MTGCLASKRYAASHHFVEHHTQRPDICSCIDFLSLRLLRRHVLSRTHNHPRISLDHRSSLGLQVNCCGLWQRELGESKVKDLYDPIAAEHNVVRLDVAVH